MKAAPNTAVAMAEHWNRRAHRFNGAASHIRHGDDWKDIFTRALGEQVRDVVDLGCGTGACALLLSELGHRVTAINGSEAMLSHARQDAASRGLDLTFIHSTIDDVKLADGSADIVTLRNVLWTLENPLGALSLAHRILRPGGTLLVSDGQWFLHRDNNSAKEFGAELPFYNGLRERDAGAMLERTGFETVVSWQHLFEVHPYGIVYDDTDRMIDFFVVTATKSS